MFTLSHISHMHARPVFGGVTFEHQPQYPANNPSVPKPILEAQKQGFTVSHIPDYQKDTIVNIGGTMSTYIDTQGRPGVRIRLPVGTPVTHGDLATNERKAVGNIIELDGDTQSFSTYISTQPNGVKITRITTRDTSGKEEYVEILTIPKINQPSLVPSQQPVQNQNGTREQTEALKNMYNIPPEFMQYVVRIDQLPDNKISIVFQPGMGLKIPEYEISPTKNSQTLTNLKAIKPNGDGTFQAVQEGMNIQISRMSIVPIVVQQVTQNNPPQAQVAPVYNNIQQNQPRPLTFAEQEMQRQKADALNKVNSYYSGGAVEGVSKVWNYLDPAGKQAFVNKLKFSSFPSPANPPEAQLSLMTSSMTLNHIQSDGRGGFIITDLPIHVKKHTMSNMSSVDYNMRKPSYISYKIPPSGRAEITGQKLHLRD